MGYGIQIGTAPFGNCVNAICFRTQKLQARSAVTNFFAALRPRFVAGKTKASQHFRPIPTNRKNSHADSVTRAPTSYQKNMSMTGTRFTRSTRVTLRKLGPREKIRDCLEEEKGDKQSGEHDYENQTENRADEDP